MTTRRRKRSCKYGKLKRRVKTNSGRRRCKKRRSRKSRKSRKSRRRSCKYGKLKRRSGRRRCRKSRRKHRINFGDMVKTYGLKQVGIKSRICKKGSKRSTKRGKSGSTTEGSGSSSCIS